MQNNVYRRLVLAVACNLSCDEAYEMLTQDYIDRFIASYNRIPNDENKPTVLDALITYTMIELPTLTGASGSITFELGSKRDVIVETFIRSNTPAMITQLASRDCILDMIRGFLRRENTISSMYAKINSSRVQGVFTQFLEVFAKHSSYAYRFDNSFKNWVMFCFIQFFYQGRKRDIWAYIREVDTTRQELELNVIQERAITVKKSDDLLVHDHLINIYKMNMELFKHNGHDGKSHGVLYDAYYLMLCELCQRKVERINAALGYDAMEFVDVNERKTTFDDAEYNRNAHSKIYNAKSLVPHVFDYIKEGRLSVASMADLRDMNFRRGKSKGDASDWVWVDADHRSETSRYLNNSAAMKNFSINEIITKGVTSIITLMTEFENRGMYLIDSYKPELFYDPDIIRYMDYLSAVPHIPLIRTLQKEPVDKSKFSPELYEFPEMVHAYAGSGVNTTTNITENRYDVITHGFMRNVRVKQVKRDLNSFERLKRFTHVMNAYPRSHIEYRITLAELNRQNEAISPFTDWVSTTADTVISGHYRSLFYNVFMLSQPSRVDYYLMAPQGMKDVKASQCLHDFKWSVGTSNYSGIELAGAYGLYIPTVGCFMFEDTADNTGMFTMYLDNIKQFINEHTVNGVCMYPVSWLYEPIRKITPLSDVLQKAVDTVGFAYDVGLANIKQADTLRRLNSMDISGVYKKYVMQYFDWLDEDARAQHSIIEVLKIIYTHCLYIVGLQNSLQPAWRNNLPHAYTLLRSLCTGEFENDSLNWVLGEIKQAYSLNMIDPASRELFVPADRSILDYLFDDGNANSRGNAELARVVASGRDPAEKFVLAFNHIHCRLNFLRYMRDAFSMLFGDIPEKLDTLVCELNDRFKIKQTLAEMEESADVYGIRTSSMDYEDVKSSIWVSRANCFTMFRGLLNEFSEFIVDCESSIAKLVEYDITSRDNGKSRFAQWGSAFALLPSYPDVMELDRLRSRAGLDAAGFFMLNGSYFKGMNGSTSYYVHFSGRMVKEGPRGLEGVAFNFDNAADTTLYRNILQKGFEAIG